MKFKDALDALKLGKKVKLPSWSGYWKLENDTVMMHCKNGEVLDIRDTQDVMYTLKFIASEDWEVLPDDYEVPVEVLAKFAKGS